MKVISLVVYLVLVLTSVQARDLPEPILPKTKVMRNISWYAGQAALWKLEVSKESRDANAWLNYYNASRYAQSSDEALRGIADEMSQEIPGTFESKLVASIQAGYTAEAFKLLSEAFNIKPEVPGSYGHMTLFKELFLDAKEREVYSRKLLMSGMVSQSLLSYSYNVLMSVEPNAVLFTDGDNTTLPLFILQDVMQVGKDVVILDIDLLEQKEYMISKLKGSGLSFLDSNGSSGAGSICAGLPLQNTNRKFYYALTIGGENIAAIKDHLFVVGLASRLSKDRLDNISIIKENLEKRFLLDYLTIDFNGENEFATGKVLSSNYLVPMLLLNDYYVQNGEKEKTEKLLQLVSKIAAESGKSDVVNHFLHREQESPISPFVTAKINWKELEESHRVVKGNLYAFRTELTNKEYNIFLDNLRETNSTELYDKCKFNLDSYDAAALAFFKGYHSPYNVIFKKGRNRASYTTSPAVNISFEAALAYCDWLTEQYNNNPGKKFKKVKFRLPTIKEWQIAALGYPKFQSWELVWSLLLYSQLFGSLKNQN